MTLIYPVTTASRPKNLMPLKNLRAQTIIVIHLVPKPLLLVKSRNNNNKINSNSSSNNSR